MFEKHINLQVKPGGKKHSLRVSQGKSGVLSISLYDGNERYMIPKGLSIDLNAVCPSGDGYLCSTEIKDGDVAVNIPSLFTEEAGTITCQLSFWEKGDYALSDTFTINVRAARADEEGE